MQLLFAKGVSVSSETYDVNETPAKWLKTHKSFCNSFKPAEIVLPTVENSSMSFKNINHHYRVPIVIYADIGVYSFVNKPV